MNVMNPKVWEEFEPICVFADRERVLSAVPPADFLDHGLLKALHSEGDATGFK